MSLICEIINIINILDDKMQDMYDVLNFFIKYFVFIVIESEVFRSKLRLNI